MFNRICSRNSSSSSQAGDKTAQRLRCTIEDKVRTQVKKCVWDISDTLQVTMALMAQADAFILTVCISSTESAWMVASTAAHMRNRLQRPVGEPRKGLMQKDGGGVHHHVCLKYHLVWRPVLLQRSLL